MLPVIDDTIHIMEPDTDQLLSITGIVVHKANDVSHTRSQLFLFFVVLLDFAFTCTQHAPSRLADLLLCANVK